MRKLWILFVPLLIALMGSSSAVSATRSAPAKPLTCTANARFGNLSHTGGNVSRNDTISGKLYVTPGTGDQLTNLAAVIQVHYDSPDNVQSWNVHLDLPDQQACVEFNTKMIFYENVYPFAAGDTFTITGILKINGSTVLGTTTSPTLFCVGPNPC
jgi:hypothetical protein